MKVGLYIRKSREEETDETLNRQQAVLTDLCVKNLWKYDIYKEVGSSQDMDRPQLQALLERVKAFYYDAVVVADLDRLSRNTVHFGMIKEVLLNAGCLVITNGKIYDFTKQEDDLFSDLQSVLAKNEYQTIKKRLVRGTRQSAKDGNYLGKKSPVGYKYNRENKRLEPTEDAPIIRRLFEEYADGLNTRDIAFKYTNENVTTSVGTIWTSSGISRLLNNPVYKGVSLYGKTTTKNGKRGVKTAASDQILIEDTHEPIVDKELWDRVQAIKQKRNIISIPLRSSKHKFSGLIQCGLCGKIHTFQKSGRGIPRIQKCLTRHYNDNTITNYTLCKNQGCNISEFEILFYNLYEEYLNELIKYRDLINSSNKPKKDNSSSRINFLEKQIKKNQQEVKRVQQGFIMEIFTEKEAQEQIKNLKTQKEAMEKELVELEESKLDTTTDYLTRVIDKMTKFIKGHNLMPEQQANEELKDLIRAIVYTKLSKGNAELNIKWKINLL